MLKFMESHNVLQSFLRFQDEAFMLIVYDVETTGLHPEKDDRIIQLSARKCLVSHEGLMEAVSANWYINPGRHIPDKVVELTGITDEFLADKPREEEVIREIADFFETSPVCGYCCDQFDNEFLRLAFERNGLSFLPEDSVDIYRVVKEVVLPGETKNQKLPTITEYFGFSDRVSAFHNAESDTMATFLCYNHLIGLCREMGPANDGHLIKCNIMSVNRYETDAGKRKIRRLYVNTDKGDFYFDISKKEWNVKDKKDRLSRYDVDDLIEKTFLFTGCSSESELCKYA